MLHKVDLKLNKKSTVLLSSSIPHFVRNKLLLVFLRNQQYEEFVIESKKIIVPHFVGNFPKQPSIKEIIHFVGIDDFPKIEISAVEFTKT